MLQRKAEPYNHYETQIQGSHKEFRYFKCKYLLHAMIYNKTNSNLSVNNSYFEYIIIMRYNILLKMIDKRLSASQEGRCSM
jgi:hypothetical protein